jgi:DNA-binding transcriptional LysR family regulator
MDISLDLYKVFYKVASVGNITRASQELAISQPAVSKSIKTLEDQLGGKLFMRSKKGVVLTDEGKEFYAHIQEAMKHIERAEGKFSDAVNREAETIRIALNPAYNNTEIIGACIKDFADKNPGVNIVIRNFHDSTIDNLLNGNVDIVALNLQSTCIENIEVIKSHKIQDCFIVGKSYKYLADYNVVTFDELTKYPLLLPLKGFDSRDSFDEFCKLHDIVVKPNTEVQGCTIMSGLVKLGMGIGYGQRNRFETGFKNGELFELKITPSIPERYSCIAISAVKNPSPVLKKLVEIIRRSH